MEQLLVDKSTAAEILSISVRGVERLIAEKRLPSIRIRRLVRIPIAALRLLAKCDSSDKTPKVSGSRATRQHQTDEKQLNSH
jgi:excisionase family DNA binding protein